MYHKSTVKKEGKKKEKCVEAYKKERAYGICMSLKLQEKVKLMKVVHSLKLIIFAFLFLRGSSSIFQI